jgi:hypothetical protein
MTSLIFLAVLLVCLTPGSLGLCRDKIIKSYPDAKCVDVDNRDNCKKECEHLGEEKCQGNRGEIRKLNCKHPDNKSGPFTCCCE